MPEMIGGMTIYGVFVVNGVGADALLSVHDKYGDAVYACNMANHLARVVGSMDQEACAVKELTLEMRAQPDVKRGSTVRRPRDYGPEFEQWWEGQSPKRRKDDVHGVYCTIKKVMVEREGPSWDFIEEWRRWCETQDAATEGASTMLERVQRFMEEVVNGGSYETREGSLSGTP